MARKVLRICDLHGRDVTADEALVIHIGSDRWQLDLCSSHMAQARRSLAPLLRAAHARPQTASRSRTVDGSRRSRTADRAELRAWARSQGYDVRDRGRVPRAAVEAYEARRAGRKARSQAS